MPQLTQEQFTQFAQQGYTHVPLFRRVIADFDTPLSIYKKLADKPFSYLLESVHGGEKWGRYSVIGLSSDETAAIYGEHLRHTIDGVTKEKTLKSPLEWVAEYQSKFNVPCIEGLPKYAGGLVGYFSYDTVRYAEPKLQGAELADELNAPDILLMKSMRVAVYDNIQSVLYLVVLAETKQVDAYKNAKAELDALSQQLAEHVDLPEISTQATTANDITYHTNQEDFEQSVRDIKEYIAAGDVMQVVPSQRMSIEYKADPLALYRALRYMNPSPYMFYLNLDDFYIVGSSPEILVQAEDGKATVRPIAGTRIRGKTVEEDAALADDLLSDSKEIAEHVMLIDLGRNDIGRITEIGNVRLTEKMVIEKYSHVMHIVSNVEGDILTGKTNMDVLAATFPAGTLSGAPKIRAMQIIDEIETVKRGVYGGAVGSLGFGDAMQGKPADMNLAIAIRTAVIKDKRLYVQAGAGVVADSDPTKEWEETCNKARAVLRAAELAQAGLNINSEEK